MKARGPYRTFARRILALLECGPRKTNVLRGLAKSERQLQRTLERLRSSGAITLKGKKKGALWHLTLTQ